MSLTGKVALITGAGQGIIADVSDRAQVYAAVDFAQAKLGGFDIMVNNAGIAQVGALADVIPEEVEKLFRVNVQGVLWGIQAAAKAFKARKVRGKIVNKYVFSSSTAAWYIAEARPATMLKEIRLNNDQR